MEKKKGPFVALLCLLGLGAFLRILIFSFCNSKFDRLAELPTAIFSGLIFDLSFFSLIFIIYILLSSWLRKSAVNFFFITILFIWTILNAIDVYSIYYNGVRSSLNSLNLFKADDIIDKISYSTVDSGFVSLLVLGLAIIYSKRNLFIPSADFKGLKHKTLYVVLFAATTLLYLPFPLSYYNDQIKMSKEARQLAVNPFFSWGTSLLYSGSAYDMNPKEALKQFEKDYYRNTTQKDFILRNVNYSDSAYNSVILIVLESFGSNRVGALNGKKHLSPNLDSLCNEGTLYTKCFACGPRTQYAISSLLFGFPHILGYNLFRENKLKLKFNGLMERLNGSGYTNHFLHGGHANYDDMDLFLKSEGKLNIKDARDISKYKFLNNWGVDDESFFDYSSEYISSFTGKNFYVLLTMSNHEPFQTPADFKLPSFSGELNGAEKTFYYSDHALGSFIRNLKRSGVYQKSLIIITGDHGENYNGESNDTKLYHVPLLIIDHKKRNSINTEIHSHADIAEYVLKKTGYVGVSHFIGRGLTDTSFKAGFYRGYEDEIYKVTDSLIYSYNPKSKVLSEFNYGKDFYVRDKKTLKLNIRQNQKIAESILSYYTANKFIFEQGMYHN